MQSGNCRTIRADAEAHYPFRYHATAETSGYDFDFEKPYSHYYLENEKNRRLEYLFTAKFISFETADHPEPLKISKVLSDRFR